jgi:putative DNA primase/helicase
VVTKSELRQMKGRLKAMVSNPTININPKNLACRSEANHMNFAFLSNELQPLAWIKRTDATW